ncbi:MAG: amino acid ABC transporter permease [Actinomycetota bacterium]
MTDTIDLMPQTPREPGEAAWRPVRLTPREWARENLFSTWYNTLLTALFGAAFAYLGYRALRFVFVTADWEIVRVNLTNFMLGRFPREGIWRVWVSAYVLIAAIGLTAGASRRNAAERAAETGLSHTMPSLVSRLRRFWPAILLVVVLVALAETIGPLLVVVGAVVVGVAARAAGPMLPRPVRRRSWAILVLGGAAWLQILNTAGGVGWNDWGGLHLTLFVTVAGIVLAFPIGLLAALARRSTLPALRILSVGYIEFVRGVPLITLLLMSQFMLRFFVPAGFPVPSDVTRALIAITLFEGAYVAEVVRGGLQAVPRGQTEAAFALGLPAPRVMRFIVLPQALRAVIPAMVGQFISLFKDTSLLTIIGVLEVLNASEVANAQLAFQGRGLASVTLPFVGLIYWVGSYTMSKESQRIERKLGVGER